MATCKPNTGMEKLSYQQLVDDSWQGVHTQRKEFEGHWPFLSSLPNVKERYFTVLASRLIRYLLINKYINILVQKGGVPGIAGCLEHGYMIWETRKKDLDVILLDLANAYGSVPDQMILLSSQMYHILEELSKMLRTYFDGFLKWFTTRLYN